MLYNKEGIRFHIHKWEEIECKNSGLAFQKYIGELFKEKLTEDFKGMLSEEEMDFPVYLKNFKDINEIIKLYSTSIKKNKWGQFVVYVSDSRNLRSEFGYSKTHWFYDNYIYLLPTTQVCLKCMQYRSSLDVDPNYKKTLKRVYQEYYKRNMIKSINKHKKIKLTLNGVEEDYEKSAANLDSFTLLLKEYKNLNEKENELLSRIKMFG